MKKLSVILLAALLLICTGCSSADGHTNVSNPKEAVITVGSHDYTREAFYQGMIASNGDSMIIQKLVSMIYADKVNEDDSEVIQKAEDDANELLEIAGEYLSFYLYYYAGVSTIDQYKEVMVYYNKLDAIADLYIDEHFDELLAENPAKLVRAIEFYEKEEAEEALTQLKSGADFESVAETGTTYFSTEAFALTDKNTSDDTALVSAVKEAEGIGYLDVISSSDESYYFVVEILDTDVNNFKDDYKDALINDAVVSEDVILPYYAKEGNFKIYDEDMYNSFKENYPAFFE